MANFLMTVASLGGCRHLQFHSVTTLMVFFLEQTQCGVQVRVCLGFVVNCLPVDTACNDGNSYSRGQSFHGKSVFSKLPLVRKRMTVLVKYYWECQLSDLKITVLLIVSYKPKPCIQACFNSEIEKSKFRLQKASFL